MSTAGDSSQVAVELNAAQVARKPVETVETVEATLRAHDNGDPLNRIAATVGVHHRGVRRVLEAAEARRGDRVLAAV